MFNFQFLIFYFGFPVYNSIMQGYDRRGYKACQSNMQSQAAWLMRQDSIHIGKETELLVVTYHVLYHGYDNFLDHFCFQNKHRPTLIF